jgi:hypothetical protein
MCPFNVSSWPDSKMREATRCLRSFGVHRKCLHRRSVGSIAAGLVEIRWDKFFEEFERADLAFVYRDAGPNGELDDFH